MQARCRSSRCTCTRWCWTATSARHLTFTSHIRYSLHRRLLLGAGKVPFEQVYLHALVRDSNKRKTPDIYLSYTLFIRLLLGAGKVPFEQVYLHALVRDSNKRKGGAGQQQAQDT